MTKYPFLWLELGSIYESQYTRSVDDFIIDALLYLNAVGSNASRTRWTYAIARYRAAIRLFTHWTETTASKLTSVEIDLFAC
jgi:hypothetical protein